MVDVTSWDEYGSKEIHFNTQNMSLSYIGGIKTSEWTKLPSFPRTVLEGGSQQQYLHVWDVHWSNWVGLQHAQILLREMAQHTFLPDACLFYINDLPTSQVPNTEKNPLWKINFFSKRFKIKNKRWVSKLL